jgi:hypothetical protein
VDRRSSRRLPKHQFLQPWLLLLLKEQPGSGYELVGRLKDFGIDDERASVYRACRLALARNGESGAGCAQAALDGSGTSPQPGRPQPESFDQPPLTQRS